VALVLALEALRLAPTFEARSALLAAEQRANSADGSTSWVINTPASHRPATITFSPDAKVIAMRTAVASFESDRKTLWLQDVRSGRLVGRPFQTTLIGDGDVAANRGGTELAFGRGNGDIWIWDRTGHHLRTLLHKKRNASYVQSVAFGPGKLLASGGLQGAIRLWNRDKGPLEPLLWLNIPQPTFNYRGLHTVAFDAHGRVVAAGSEGGTIVLWSVPDRELLGAPIVDLDTQVQSVAVSPDGKTLAAAAYGDDTIRLWDVPEGRALGNPIAAKSISALVFTPDGKGLLSASRETGNRLRIRSWANELWSDDRERLIARGCEIASRNLTSREWAVFIPDAPYHRTCQRWPAGK
jgi:WD40 repeat protein